MSQSGTFTLQSNSYDGRYLKLTCTSSQDVTNNRTKVNWTLESIGGSSGHYSTIVTVNINGTQVYSIDQGYSYDAFPVTKGSTSGTVYVNMNTDGSHSPITIYMDAAIYVSSTTRYSDTYVLPTIPRYTTIKSFTVSKRNETSFTFNWQTANTVDYIQYSTNNGSSYTNLDVTDGTSGSFTVSGLSPSTTYNCKIKVRRKDSGLYTESAVVSQTTYAVPTQSLSSKTETSITMNWSCDTTASKIRYSTNNGSSWSSYITVSAKTGSYTITGLSANTAYNIKTEVTRSSTSTAYSTTASSQTTYNYPYITKVGTTTLTIGNSQTLTLYNPLSRTVTIKMYKTNTSGTQLYSGTTNTTSITFTPTANTLYASIPNDTKVACVYSAIYSSSTKTVTGSYYYQVDSSACKPTFTNFAYKDTASNDLITAIDNDQVIVQNVSDINIVISSANKMVAKNSATASKYVATLGTLSKNNITYSSSDIDTNLGIPTAKGSQTLTVTAYDSRGLNTSVPQTINVIEYASPIVTPSLTRLNNFEAETHFSVSGTFSKVTIDNTDKNLVKKVEYRYKESTSSTWESWTEITMSSQGNGSYQTEEVVMNFDNTKAFDFQFRTEDRAKTTTVSYTLNVGQPLMFLDTNGNLEIYNNETIGNDLTVNNRTTSNQGFTVIHLNGGAGTSGYMYACDLKITSQYQDQWIIFNTVQRNRFGKIYLRFLGGSTTDPTLRSFVKSGSGGFSAFIVKAATSTWAMYIQKSESYDDIEITGIEKGRYANGIQITWKNITVTSVPTGYTEAAMATIDVKASNATSADTATSATSATNATNASKVEVTSTNPSSNTTYYPTWVSGSGTKGLGLNNGLSYVSREGTTSADGTSYLILGNSTASGTAKNKTGFLRIYDKTAYYTQVECGGSTSANRTWKYPNHSGTFQGRATNLYNNTTGTNGTVTLSASSANYSWLDIYYYKAESAMGGNIYDVVRVYSPDGKLVTLGNSHVATNSVMQTIAKLVSISTTKITVKKEILANFTVGTTSVTECSSPSTTQIRIVRVDGWV